MAFADFAGLAILEYTTINSVFVSVGDTVNNPSSLIVVPSDPFCTVNLPDLPTNPVPSIVPVNCVILPFATVAVVGEIVTLVISGCTVVNKIALENGEIEKVFHT